jgi:hypothetical protein
MRSTKMAGSLRLPAIFVDGDVVWGLGGSRVRGGAAG